MKYDSAKLKEELIRDEGFRLDAYKDTEDLWTIGIGHLLGTEKRMVKITRAEANALYEADVRAAEELIQSYNLGWIEGARARVLVNMAFNLGSRLAGFKNFLDACRIQFWSKAAIEMMDSKWATQVGDRAIRLKEMMEKGGA